MSVLPPILYLILNILAWNCRGPQKPSFQKHVREMVYNHDLAIMIVIETRIGGNRARDIIDRLPFDRAIHIDTIGYGFFGILKKFRSPN